MNKVSFALPSPPASPGDANAWKAGKGSSVDCSSRSQSNWLLDRFLFGRVNTGIRLFPGAKDRESAQGWIWRGVRPSAVMAADLPKGACFIAVVLFRLSLVDGKIL